ncbi:MAG: hypothetical protein HQ546_05820 [Planctomycetes bacterium]|nr:hypothetical protein [Planctomycetota bacterium]
MLLLATVVLAVAPPRASGDAIAEKRLAQGRLLAYRAARADAMRKLAERVVGLQINSTTTVKDFVTESDVIETSMQAFLNGLRETGEPKYMEDGTCEVTMQVKLKSVVANLKQGFVSHYKGDKVKIEDFTKMTVTNRVDVIRETGSGVAPPSLLEDPLVSVTPASVDSLTNLEGEAKAYWLSHCKPQGRLGAVRAARVDAMRRLAERIKGVMITSNTTVQDFVATSDQVDLDLRCFLRGAREVGIRYHLEEPVVEVEMAVTVRELLAEVKTWGAVHCKDHKVTVEDFDKVIVKTSDKVIRETGMGVPAEQYLISPTPGDKAVRALAEQAPPWATKTKEATGDAAIDPGISDQAQAKLMAERGAEVIARRKLAERINALTITPTTKMSVKDFVAAGKEIESAMLTFQQGAKIVDGSQKLIDDHTLQLTVEIDLKPLWNMILHYQKKLSLEIE